MITIFAHRAIINSKENSVEGILDCIKQNFSIELDLRIKNDFVYMSHEPDIKGDSFETACKILKKTKHRIALHVKETKAVKKIIKLLYKYSIYSNCFLFSDSESYTTLKKLANDYVEVASYVSKKPESIKSSILWCDESKGQWYSAKIFDKLHLHNKIIYAMSKELLEPSTMKEIVSDWKRLLKLNLDGICTDYPNKLAEFLKQEK